MGHLNERLPIFTERFRELKGKRNDTEFAEFLGISRQTVGFFGNGNRLPDALTLVKISQKCEVSADWLLGLSHVKSRDSDLQQTCNYIGLSEGAVEFLRYIGHDLENNNSDIMPIVLSLLLENYRFFQVLGGIALACSLECQYQGPGDTIAIDKFNKEHKEELNKIGGTVWDIGATSDMFLNQASKRFMDCIQEVRLQFAQQP